MRTSSDMEVFVAVIDRGSLSAAAKSLGVTRSAVCRRLDQLESRLGVRLLHRTPRKLSLTEPGRIYLDHGRQALVEIDRAEQAAASFQANPRGILRVRSPVMIGLHIIIPWMREFLTNFPELSINLVVSDETNYSPQDFDLVIAFGPQPDSSLIAQKLGDSRRIICAAPSYLADHPAPQQPEDLRDHNCLTLSYLGSQSNEWSFKGSDGTFTVRVSGNFVANNGDANYEALIAGIGIGRATDLRVSSDVAAGRLVALLRSFEPDAPTPIYALHHSREQVPPKVRTFIDFYSKRLSLKGIPAAIGADVARASTDC
jgi:DNA-binding transcriptional LysR family regulator